MADIYGKKADIVHEIEMIVNGIYNGQNIEALLKNFAERSHLDDVESFATIFECRAVMVEISKKQWEIPIGSSMKRSRWKWREGHFRLQTRMS